MVGRIFITQVIFSMGFFFLLLFNSPSVAAEQDLRTGLSFQGYTGLLNTPTTDITPTGTIDLLYSDQVEPQWRPPVRRSVSRQDNYMFSVGIFSFLEVGARLSEAPGRARDLSANVKVKVPLIPDHLPQFAFGIQDVAGGAPHLRNTYAVMSYRWKPLLVSAGYGFGKDRMEGAFGGVALHVTNWLQLLAEHDTYDTAAGIRLLSPRDLLPVDIGATLRAAVDDPGDIDVAISLRIPLGRKTPKPVAARPAVTSDTPARTGSLRPTTTIPSPANFSIDPDSTTEAKNTARGTLSTGSAAKTDIDWQVVETILSRLAELGFENIRVGVIGTSTFFAEFENSHFNANEVDGLGLALGTIARMLSDDFDRVVVRLKNSDIPVIEVTSPVTSLRGYFLATADDQLSEVFQTSKKDLQVRFSPYRRPANLELLPQKRNAQFGRSTLIIHPGIRNTIGTEVGVLDYRLSARLDLVTRLWQGASLNLRADIPVAWSDEFADGGVFQGDGHNDPVIDRVFFAQNFRLFSNVTAQFSGGLFLEDMYGAMNTTILQSSGGSHRLRFRGGVFEDSDTKEQTELYVGSYRYYLAPWDLFFEASAGQFLSEDTGYQIEFKRFFGDTSVSAVYTDTEEQTIAFRISFPLGPRKDFRPGLLQVRGSERFNYQISSVLAEKGGRNPIVFGVGVNPQTMVDPERTVYNSDRLNPGYITEHLPRMRQSYLRFRAD